LTTLTATAAPDPDSPGHGVGLAGRRRAVAIFTVLSAMTLAVLDAGMANVALPSIGLAFDIAPAHAIAVITA